jgi:nitrogen fixation protein NifU and related proteins
MSELLALYQSLILQHNRVALFQAPIADATHRAVGDNPLCGDRIELVLRIYDDRIEALQFTGSMSAITRASAQMMCGLVHQQSTERAHRLYRLASALLFEVLSDDTTSELGDFAAMRILRSYPNRIKTAALPWAALHAALTNAADPITTE